MDWWNALTSGVDLFAKMMTPLKQLKDLLQTRPANAPAPASPEEQQRVATMESTIAELERRLTLFSPTELLNDMQAWQAMQENLFATRLQQARAQEAERIAQMLQHVDATTELVRETVTDVFMGPMELLWNLLPFVYPELRIRLIEAIDMNSNLKNFLLRYDATAVYQQVTDETSLEALCNQWRKSIFDTPLTRLARTRDQGKGLHDAPIDKAQFTQL
jgi:hypothetical protein